MFQVARVRLHGFSEREVSIVRAQLLAEIESAYLERDQMQSTSLRDDYLQVNPNCNFEDILSFNVHVIYVNQYYISRFASIFSVMNLLSGLNTKLNSRRVFYLVSALNTI